jgi:hypothetical protein
MFPKKGKGIMRTFLPCLALAAVVALCGCADQPTPTGILAPDVPAPALAMQGSPGDQVQYRVTGDYVLTQHSWPIFARLEISNLDAWITRDGVPGGSMDFRLVFAWGASISSHEDIVCLSVNPANREMWVVAVRYGAGGEPHYSIAQARDLAPASMSETGHVASGRRDIATGRSMMPWEGPDFCMEQPDLASIAHPAFGPVEMFPIAEGDVRLQMGAARGR